MNAWVITKNLYTVKKKVNLAYSLKIFQYMLSMSFIYREKVFINDMYFKSFNNH